MKRAGWKDEDRALSVRGEIAQAGRVAWHSPSRGTFNNGRNAAKAKRRAPQFGQPWVNPRAAVPRPTKPVAPAEGHPHRESRRKAKNRKKKPVSAHTQGFRAMYEPLRFEDGSLGAGRRYVGDSAPIRVK